ncbi:MAG: phage tail protein [Bacteroidetes bacterium]|nr:MAG: phage tail protein [Bacteroidota bacterium]
MPNDSNSDAFYPPAGFYFSVNFAGISSEQLASFQEVSGISMEMETKEITEGGENQFSRRVPSGVKYQNLVLKRGLMIKNSPIAQWCQDTLSSGFEKVIKPKSIVVSLLDESAKPIMNWAFHNAYPVKWEISDLKSSDNALVIETLEFTYSYFESKPVS